MIYIPILRWKQGERIALLNLAAPTRAKVTPHIVITQSQFGAAEVVAKQIGDAWGKTKFYLDASDLPGTAAKHSLDDIRAKAKAIGLLIVPSIKLNAPSEYTAAATRAVKSDDRGIALRISLAQLTSAASWTPSWSFPKGETDLIVDLSSSASNVLALGQSVHTAFQSLHQAKAWRSVTMAGGNIPANLSGYAVGLTALPRAELKLWWSLQKAGLPYDLHFGDYAVIGPDATTEGIEGPVPINAKYSLIDDFAVFHGVKTKGPGSKPRDQQYRSYANQIVKLAKRNALAHCWGDKMIDAIAASPTSAPGSPASWVSYSVNRHIELTISQLP